MKINANIERLLEESPHIDRGAALMYLFRLWAGITAETEITASIIRAVNHMKIVEINPETETLLWNMPLFSDEEVIDIFSGWVEEYRAMFRDIRVSAMGSKRGVYSKMEKFLRKDPKTTAEEVLKATTLYIDDLKRRGQTSYIMNADNFISKQDADRSVKSGLEIWIEILREGKFDVNVDYSQNIVE